MSKLFLHEYIKKLAGGNRFISFIRLANIVFKNIEDYRQEYRCNNPKIFISDYFYIGEDGVIDLCKPKKLAEILEYKDEEYDKDIRDCGEFDFVEFDYYYGFMDMLIYVFSNAYDKRFASPDRGGDDISKYCNGGYETMCSDVRKNNVTMFVKDDNILLECVCEEIQPTYSRYYSSYNIDFEDIPF